MQEYMPRQEEAARVNRGAVYVFHLVALVWTLANTWASLPVHSCGAASSISLWMVFLLNPAAFGACAWIGRRRASIAIGVVWPVFVMLIWVLVPAFGAAYRWGWDSFGTFLLRVPSWDFIWYLGLCVLSYGICAVLASRARAKQDCEPCRH